MGKVKVSKKVYNAMEETKLWSDNKKGYNSIMIENKVRGSFIYTRECLNELDFDLFLNMLVNGYEVEETPEEKILDMYNKLGKCESMSDNFIFRGAISWTLDTLGIKIKGINEE